MLFDVLTVVIGQVLRRRVMPSILLNKESETKEYGHISPIHKRAKFGTFVSSKVSDLRKGSILTFSVMRQACCPYKYASTAVQHLIDR
jgi:hypothetical protein